MSDLVLSGDSQNSWLSLDDAETYMRLRFGSIDFWSEDIDQTVKEAALVTAYNDIVGSGLYTIPTTATQALKDAQCEQALFLLQHGRDADMRMGLQEQNVQSAGIAKESYRDNSKFSILSYKVHMLLRDSKIEYGFEVGEITRDENEDI